jgi:hypothetical protein
MNFKQIDISEISDSKWDEFYDSVKNFNKRVKIENGRRQSKDLLSYIENEIPKNENLKDRKEWLKLSDAKFHKKKTENVSQYSSDGWEFSIKIGSCKVSRIYEHEGYGVSDWCNHVLIFDFEKNTFIYEDIKNEKDFLETQELILKACNCPIIWEGFLTILNSILEIAGNYVSDETDNDDLCYEFK